MDKFQSKTLKKDQYLLSKLVSNIDKTTVLEIQNISNNIEYCRKASYYSHLDILRAKKFKTLPCWCIDFSEIYTYIEGRYSAFHIIEHFLQNRIPKLYILPGTIFEIFKYLHDNYEDLSKHSIDINLFKQMKTDESDREIYEELFDFFRKNNEKIHDIIKFIVNKKEFKSEPIKRLIELLQNKNLIYYHQLPVAVENMYLFPNYREKFNIKLNEKRHSRKINNSIDALNITICYSINRVKKSENYFLYVTKDKTCFSISEEMYNDGDKLLKFSPSYKSPLCRSPFSVLIFEQEVKDEKNGLSLSLSELSKELSKTLISLPEYEDAVTNAIDNNLPFQGMTINIRFSEKYEYLIEILEKIRSQFLDFFLIGITENSMKYSQLLESSENQYESTIQSEIKSFEKLYHDVVSKAIEVKKYFDLIEHLNTTFSIEKNDFIDSNFECNSYEFYSNDLQRKRNIICFIDRYKDFSSIWWNYDTNIVTSFSIGAFFLDIVQLFMRNCSSESLDDSEKCFKPGIIFAKNPNFKDEEIFGNLIFESFDFSDSFDATELFLTEKINEHNPISIRINTGIGDFWINLPSTFSGTPRMGIITHTWDAILLSKVLSLTNKHYINTSQLEKYLKTTIFYHH